MRPKFRRRGYVEIFCSRYVLLVSGRKANLGQLPIFGMNSRRRKIRAKYSRREAIDSYGPRTNSPEIIRRYEEPTGLDIRADGFPAEMTDDEPEEQGYEVVRGGRL